MKAYSSSFLANIERSYPVRGECNCKNTITIVFIVVPLLSIYCGIMSFSGFAYAIKKQKSIGICASEFISGLLLILGLGIIILALSAISNVLNCRELI